MAAAEVETTARELLKPHFSQSTGSAVRKPPRIKRAAWCLGSHVAEQRSLEHAILFSFSIDQLSGITMYKDFPLQVVRACNSLSLSCITLISILSHHLLPYYFVYRPHPPTPHYGLSVYSQWQQILCARNINSLPSSFSFNAADFDSFCNENLICKLVTPGSQ